MSAPRGASLGGIWGFALTPFDERGEVDLDALAAAVAHQVEGGVDVVVAAGVIAESESLSEAERRAIAAVVVQTVAGAVPVLVTVPPGLAEACAGAVEAARLGADGLLVLPPERGGADGLASHLSRLAQVGQLDLILYHRGGLLLEPHELERLAQIDALVGLKDSQRDFRRFRRFYDRLADRLLFVAAWEDLTLPYWALGAAAFAPASTAHDPWYARAWYDLLSAGDVASARVLLEAFAYPFTDLRVGRLGIDVAVVKCAMCVRGLPGGAVRPPGAELDAGEEERVRGLLQVLDRLAHE